MKTFQQYLVEAKTESKVNNTELNDLADQAVKDIIQVMLPLKNGPVRIEGVYIDKNTFGGKIEMGVLYNTPREYRHPDEHRSNPEREKKQDAFEQHERKIHAAMQEINKKYGDKFEMGSMASGSSTTMKIHRL